MGAATGLHAVRGVQQFTDTKMPREPAVVPKQALFAALWGQSQMLGYQSPRLCVQTRIYQADSRLSVYPRKKLYHLRRAESLYPLPRSLPPQLSAQILPKSKVHKGVHMQGWSCIAQWRVHPSLTVPSNTAKQLDVTPIVCTWAGLCQMDPTVGWVGTLQ
ncbi:hypothetical protein XENTR_v10019642 [Xenopus tropicalis]|nr:hypothetical protein XENTR_v10019642 [Xenopus tropicalis]